MKAQINMQETGRILKIKGDILFVISNQNGTITIAMGDDLHPNAGSIIGGFGGVQKTIERLGEETSFSSYLEMRKNFFKEIKQAKSASSDSKAKKCDEAFNALMNASENGIIESNAENCKIVLEYLNCHNWGSWNLPQMTIGYKCNQYTCSNGISKATTMILDEPINVSSLSRFDETSQNLVVGAPRNELTKYTHI